VGLCVARPLVFICLRITSAGTGAIASGSDAAFQRALGDFATQTQHPNWRPCRLFVGHSGGAFWSSLMLTLHPERIAAIFFRSGSAFGAWGRGEIPKPELTPAVYTVPFMFNRRREGSGGQVHGPPRLDDRAMWKQWRETRCAGRQCRPIH